MVCEQDNKRKTLANPTYVLVGFIYLNVFTLTANELPSVNITSPANGTVYFSAASITINADASDPDGTIVRVEFYVDNGYIGQDTTSSYSYIWTTLTRGPHVLTAKAIDNAGGETVSAPINITINNVRPAVSITSPANNTAFYPPPAASITITADASDVDGTVT
ncbi:MAG: Ig-like domain-containing protein, partial [Planctomycetota bacterium]|nr:Ig-like domain-containing protein [Planctomycetota bacterium]